MNTLGNAVLIGQYDSPFVRRVAIALTLYEIPFEHRPWSVFRDRERIATYNPLRRVPTFVLPNGEVLIESSIILDALDDQVADDRVLLPRRGAARRKGLKIAALACGIADKAVALVYERVAREADRQSPLWTERCSLQVASALALLEQEREAAKSRWWLGEQLSHADIAVGVVMHFLAQTVPQLLAELELPALVAHEAICHQRPEFIHIDQPFNCPQ